MADHVLDSRPLTTAESARLRGVSEALAAEARAERTRRRKERRKRAKARAAATTDQTGGAA